MRDLAKQGIIDDITELAPLLEDGIDPSQGLDTDITDIDTSSAEVRIDYISVIEAPPVMIPSELEAPILTLFMIAVF